MLNSLSWGGAFPSFYFIRFVKHISRSMIAVAICLLFSMLGAGSDAFATGYLAKAVPSQIESIRAQGFLIVGDFGNGSLGSDCTSPNSIWVAITHPQYDQLYSMAMSAMLGGKQLWGYAHQCATIGWHGGTFNEITGAGVLYIVR